MLINTLKLKNKRRQRKTIGRGGKKGTYSGKGNKGQKARSGVSINPLFEGGRSTLVDHMKKKKGFKALVAKKTVVNISRLEKKMQDGDAVSAETLIKAGIVDRIEAKQGIKLLGQSAIKKKLQIDKAIKVSASAKKSIENAGGKVATEK